MTLNEIPTEFFGYDVAGLLYRGRNRYNTNVVEYTTDNGSEWIEVKFTPEEIPEFLNRFEMIQETILDPNEYYSTRQVVYQEKATGEFWALQFSQDSWEDDGNFGDQFDWFPVVETEKVIKIYQKK